MHKYKKYFFWQLYAIFVASLVVVMIGLFLFTRIAIFQEEQGQASVTSTVKELSQFQSQINCSKATWVLLGPGAQYKTYRIDRLALYALPPCQFYVYDSNSGDEMKVAEQILIHSSHALFSEDRFKQAEIKIKMIGRTENFVLGRVQ